MVGNYTDQQSRTALGVTYNSAGALGASPDSYAASQPKFRGTVAATYTQGPWSVTAQARSIGSARLSNGTQGVPGIVQASLSSTGVLTPAPLWAWSTTIRSHSPPIPTCAPRYNLNDNFQIYGAVDNVTNTPPPNIPSTLGGGGTQRLGL